MGETTKIEWTDHTFNPWIGCTKVSEGCRNCYAARDNERRKWNGGVWGPGTLRKVTSQANWHEPLKWAKAARASGAREKVFCASLADVFDLEAPRQARKDLWSLIGDTFDALDWQLVTKRPENILPALDDDGMGYGLFEVCKCWLITTAENQAAADRRIPLLLDVPASVYGVSVEPLIGPLRLDRIGEEPEGYIDALQGYVTCDGRGTKPYEKLDWVIVGGESGPGARRMNSEWVESLQDQCAAAGVAFFFKQWAIGIASTTA
jgi:protein gp37